MRELEFNI